MYHLASMTQRAIATPNPTVMISYSHRDTVHMERIKRELREAGFQVLVDQDQFSLSYSTTPEMNRLVDTANLLLILMSPDSIASKAVRHEVKRGLKREYVEHRKIVFAAMVRPCSHRIAGWPKDRLWCCLYSDYDKSFRKLVRNLHFSAKSVVPLAQALPTCADLATTMEGLLIKDGIRVPRKLEFFSRFGPKFEDDPARGAIALPITYDRLVGPAFISTYRDWMLFWHFPKVALTSRTLLCFSEALFVARALLDARIGGYMHRPDRKVREPWTEDLVRLARRHRRLMDVVVSPHPISPTNYIRENLALLKWQRLKPFLIYHKTEIYSHWHSLPVFFVPRSQTIADLHTALRFLKAVIRVEVPRLRIPTAPWNFLEPSFLKLSSRKPKRVRR